MQSQGFIIKSYVPKKNMYSIVDQEHGHIHCFSHKVWPVGAHLFYTLSPQQMMYGMQQAEFYNLPCDLTFADLTFIHQVFELVFMAMPVGIQAPELFAHLCWLYQHYNIQLHSMVKKIFLCQLCCILGIQPERYGGINGVIQKIVKIPIDRINAESLDLAQYDNALDAWISDALVEHIAVGLTKTLAALLVMTGSYENM